MKKNLSRRALALMLAMLTVILSAAFAGCAKTGTEGGNESTATAGENVTEESQSEAETEATEEAGPIIVQTNPYFAPFEYYSEDAEIVGVDPDIMAKVGEKLGREVQFNNVEFEVIIPNVASGKICDCGAAGITITEARKEQVDFSIPYFTSIQYVIYPEGMLEPAGQTVEGDNYVLWDQLAGLKIGVQRDTTGDIYVSDEINCSEENGDSFTGVLYGTDASSAQFDNGQLATDACGANQIDVVVIDKLPASYIVTKNEGYECAALYYAGGEGEEDSPTSEDYAIAVNKDQPELLEAINEVLTEMLVVNDATGMSEVEALVAKYFGIDR